jgi:MFS family permease
LVFCFAIRDEKDDATVNTKRLSRNIPLFYCYQLFNSFILDRGIWMLYLLANGFSLTEIGIIEALYHAVIFLFEVPTGYIADRYGKRTSLLLSQFLGIITAACLMLADSPTLIVFGFLLSGLVGTLQSGATSALIYETLKVQGKQSGYVKLNSRLSAIVLISMGLSGSLGGVLSDIHWEWVYAGKILVHAATSLIAWSLIEPPLAMENEPALESGLIVGSDSSKNSDGAESNNLATGSKLKRVSFLQQLRDGYSFIRTNRAFLSLSCFGALLYSMLWSISFYSQVLFQNNGLPNAAIGTINGVETWVSAGITAIAYLGERWLGKKGSLLLSSIGFTVCLIVFSASQGSLMIVGSFFMLSVFISYLEPLLEAYLQELVPSPMRATMLSVFNMMVSSGMMVTFFALGFLGDRIGIVHGLQAVLWFWIPLLFLLILWCLKYNSPSTNKMD